MQGYVKFTPMHGEYIFYYEEGKWNTFDKRSIAFYKEYVYFHKEDTLKIYKSYNREKLEMMHELHFAGLPLSAKSTYLCSQDQYNLSFTIYSPKYFTTYYKVVGPKKNLTVLTKYSRGE